MLLLRPGEKFADCRILSLCGSGGMGVVYLAEDFLHRKVALKIVALGNAERELRGIQQYISVAEKNPGMVRIYRAGIEQGQLFYIMEAADPLLPADPVYKPKTLAALLKQQGALPPGQTLELIRYLGEGLQLLHDAHLIHRDIKPENIIFVNGVPKLCDPGLVCIQDATISFSGTLGYLPRECFTGENLNSPDRDLYALGMVFYVAVTGEVPARYPRMPLSLHVAARKKLWPLLVRVCNSNPRRRFNSVEEFLAALPAELPEPNWLDRCNEAFREYRLLHPSFVFKCCITLLVLLLAGSAVAVFQFHSSRRKAAYLEKCRNECRLIELRLKGNPESLSAQLEAQNGSAALHKFRKAVQQLPEAPEARLRRLKDIGKKLTETALRMIPEQPQKKDIRSVEQFSSRSRSLLSSPLGLWLPIGKRAALEKQTTEMEVRCITKTSRLKPGQDFYPDLDFSHHYVYVPAGVFRDARGKLVSIPHGFWCGDSEISTHVFSKHTDSRWMLSNRELPQVKFGWNDLLGFCRKLTILHQGMGILPEGYIFRPLTSQEWYWAYRNAWAGKPEAPAAPSNADTNQIHTVYTGTPSKLGIYNMKDNVSEITLSAENEKIPNCVHLCGNNYRHGPRPEPVMKHYLKYQNLPPYVGSRVAVVSGDLGFFDREHWYMDARPLFWKDRVFDCIAAHCATFPRQNVRELCELLGAHLGAPDDPELLRKLPEIYLDCTGFAISVDAVVRDGKLFTSAGKPYQHVPCPAPPVKPEHCLCFNRGLIQYMVCTDCCGFLCEWSKKEYEKRTDLARILKSRCIMHTFRHRKKLYVLVSCPALIFPVRQIAMILGAKLAEPRTPELRELMKQELAPWSKKPIFLGGFWKFDHWEFPDGTELKMKLEHRGFSVSNSFNFAAPGLLEGNFHSLQRAQCFLLEFPLP